MKVRLLTDRATMLGPAQREGDEIEVSRQEGEALIRTNQAVRIDETKNQKPKARR